MKRKYGVLAAGLVLGLIVVNSCEVSTMSSDQERDPALFSFTAIQVDPTAMFSGQEDHVIISSTAHEMITRYDKNFVNEPNGWFFARDAMLALLAQDGVVGLRIYHALKEDGSYSQVIFGVTSDGNDVDVDGGLGKLMGAHEIVILDVALPCPPFCGGGD
ncbi:MAG: hypothetical protein IIA59_09255 [Candidatus Marinimicrobia bacterium]|nr:hypothetical protein [Candidatus Neomarinimicrobiota bacterium]